MNKNNKKKDVKKQKNNKLAKKVKNKIIKNKNDEKIAQLKNNLNIENVVSIKKLKFFLFFCFLLFFLLIVRLFYLQLINGSYLASLATKQQTTSEKISSKRGNIYDRTGSALAISETVDTISITPSKLKFKKNANESANDINETVAKGFSEIFELNYEEILSKITESQSSFVVARKVEENKVDELKNWIKSNNIVGGINIEEDTKRFYPYGSSAAQVIGSCGTDNQGQAGVEYSYDSILKGISGTVITSSTASQGEIPNSQQAFIEAENGYNLTLTIDMNIQSIVEKYLKQAVEENECSNGGNAILMDPKTGDILAMASYPTYDLNSPRTPTSFYADNWDSLSSSEQLDRIFKMWKVRSVSETYEPGSVFKVITAAVALEENITQPDKSNDFYCNGVEDIYGTLIRCWYSQAPYFGTHQGESLREALMDSCNPSFMQLGRRIGASLLYKYYDAFGFFDKTKSGLPGEATGIFHNLNDVRPVELATMSFGQRFTITPLQMCTAISAITNNGNLVRPKIIKSMTNTDTGETIEFETEKIRQVVSSQTSSQIRSMMESVVTDGTGKHAKVEGYAIGGKSGTSEPLASDTNAGYTTSFIAISPIENTQVVLLITLYDPTRKKPSRWTNCCSSCF